MVPAVDRKDTEQFLNGLREKAEAVRTEIESWSFMTPNADNQSEAMALRKLASRSAQQARQWTGRMLKELDTEYPYPNSADSSTDIIDKTSVPQVQGLDLPADFPTVRRIKHVRMTIALINAELNTLLEQCIPGSFFNQCLFRVQEHTIQTGMWLGELLHQFYVEEPKGEPFTLNTLKEIVSGVAANLTPEHAQAVIENNQHVPAFAEALASGKNLSGNTTLPSTPTETLSTGSDFLNPSSTSSTENEDAPDYSETKAGIPELTTEDSKG